MCDGLSCAHFARRLQVHWHAIWTYAVTVTPSTHADGAPDCDAASAGGDVYEVVVPHPEPPPPPQPRLVTTATAPTVVVAVAATVAVPAMVAPLWGTLPRHTRPVMAWTAPHHAGVDAATTGVAANLARTRTMARCRTSRRAWRWCPKAVALHKSARRAASATAWLPL